MTNEQAVIDAQAKIVELKKNYMEMLDPIVSRCQDGIKPSLQELSLCQRIGAEYFNYVESFVGSSGLLGAHVNGKWVTGFAETCHAVLGALIHHHNFLRSYDDTVFNGKLSEPSVNSYANMQRMVKEYLQASQCKELEQRFIENNIPINGFKYRGTQDLKETPKWMLITGLCIGSFFALVILAASFFIPNPTDTQFFIFRGIFAISIAAIAVIIPGFLTITAKYNFFFIKASGAIAVFVIIWLINPPILINSI